MFENDLHAAATSVGDVELPTASRVGIRNHALSGSRPRLSANTVATIDDPSVVSNSVIF
ncbi:hypothetical protein SAMN05421504_103313 [Amycolatopsis xylanica]|uniref:Uncharacterized protein n=1 Tax=Amycolatopsis xylanica TaxID=589385 RepID=A0A1H3DA76_9PSEU|nr:hypothetical protein [Amycolatopsis xylanica]SDX63301.1 hypothetical protein SAMN05421504_103313 [Amycolatopsis xylanica]